MSVVLVPSRWALGLKMKTLGLVLFAAISLAAAARDEAWAEEARAKQVAYEKIEPMVQSEFNEMMKLLRKKGEDMGQRPTEADMDALKLLYYNKAYNYYVCTLEAVKRSSEAGEIEKIFYSCAEPRNASLYTFMAKMNNYAGVIGVNAFKRCGLASRLFDAELEFKPYSFLWHEGAELHDYEKYNLCIIDAAK
jgi:hypothetical protein